MAPPAQIAQVRQLSSEGIFVDPEPSVVHSRPSQRRNRTASPGATARNASSENRDPLIEQNLLARINNASKDELSDISGFGPKTVEQILQCRNKHGDLQKLSDLVELAGMTNGAFGNFQKKQRL